MTRLPFLRWPEAALTLARTFGVRGGALRALHEMRRVTGRFRAAPRFEIAAAPHAQGPWSVDPTRLASATDRRAAIERADRIVAGDYLAFGHEWRALPAGPGWRRHPDTGREFPLAAWWHVPHLSPTLGDIKQVWEPARFGWVYDLVRAWSLTGDPRYPATAHRIVADWGTCAPPYRGPHWACGQETAIRAIALLHAEANLPATAEERHRVTRILGWSGERIADAIGYAISQRNNHSLSEAAGLIALGVRLAGRHPEADRWVAVGRRILEREIRAQFAPDGWYIQHSFNYLRLALDQCVVAESALRARGLGLSPGSQDRLRAALQLVAAVMGPEGDVPNHGPNDGALVLPRSSAPYHDYRPTFTQAAILFGVPVPADILPDPEASAWLGGALPVAGPARPDGISRGVGWAAIRRRGVIVFLRAGRYRSRPGHLDVLHLDVRGPRGPIVVDPGTFKYNASPPWNNGLATARVHNGPLLDDREPGVRGPRFLWYLWPAGEIDAVETGARGDRLRARSVTGVSREVEVGPGVVTVRDRVEGGRASQLHVRWTLHPDAKGEPISIEGESEAGWGGEGAVMGWFSPHYGERLRTRYIDARRPALAGAEIVTRIRTDQ